MCFSVEIILGVGIMTLDGLKSVARKFMSWIKDEFLSLLLELLNLLQNYLLRYPSQYHKNVVKEKRNRTIVYPNMNTETKVAQCLLEGSWCIFLPFFFFFVYKISEMM